MKHRQDPLEKDQDTFSVSELYQIIRIQLHRHPARMDTALLRETLLALDERTDAEAAPRQAMVWERIDERIRHKATAVVPGMTRRAVAILAAILLLLLMTGAAIAKIDWSAVFRHFYQMERQESRIEKWPLEEKQEITEALREAGYDMTFFPSLEGKSEEEQDRLLTEWIEKQADGGVDAGFYNLLTRMKGIYDSWSFEDKAWFDQMRVEGHDVVPGDFISCFPADLPEIEKEKLIRRAWDLVHTIYDDTAAEPETWTPYLFYGYIYPDADKRFWKIHFRGENLENEMTVLVAEGNISENEMTVIMQSDVPEDVG